MEVRARNGCCRSDKRRSALADLRSVLSIFFSMFSVSANRACSSSAMFWGNFECPVLVPLCRHLSKLEAERLPRFCWHDKCQCCLLLESCSSYLILHAVATLQCPPAAHLEVLFESIKPQAQRFELLVRVHAWGSHNPLLDLPDECQIIIVQMLLAVQLAGQHVHILGPCRLLLLLPLHTGSQQGQAGQMPNPYSLLCTPALCSLPSSELRASVRPTRAVTLEFQVHASQSQACAMQDLLAMHGTLSTRQE